jgi:hypothetical protein
MKAACDEGELSGTGGAAGGGESPLLASLFMTFGSAVRLVAVASLQDGGARVSRALEGRYKNGLWRLERRKNFTDHLPGS